MDSILLPVTFTRFERICPSCRSTFKMHSGPPVFEKCPEHNPILYTSRTLQIVHRLRLLVRQLGNARVTR